MNYFMHKGGISGSACKLAAAGLAGLLTVTFAGSAMAQNIVVRSSGPSAQSYPVGNKLKEGTLITLSSGDRITVLNNSRTQVLSGPGRFTIGRQAARSSTIGARVANFVNRKGGRVRTGAVRGDPGSASAAPPKVPNMWFLDPVRGGNFCIANTTMLMAWRADMSGDANTAISDPDNGTSGALNWNDGSRLKSWPVDAAPLSDGATYHVTSPGSAQPVHVTFMLLSDPPAEIDALVETLIAKGCQNQVDAIVDAVSDEPA